MANGAIVKAVEKKIKLQENIKREVSKKLNPHPYYPPMMTAIVKTAGRIFFFAWPVLIFFSQLLLGMLRGVVDGLDRGMAEALKAYRKW